MIILILPTIIMTFMKSFFIMMMGWRKWSEGSPQDDHDSPATSDSDEKAQKDDLIIR